MRAWCLGIEVAQYDVDLFRLAKAAEWIALRYSLVPAPDDIYILSRNAAAPTHITDFRSLNNQSDVLTVCFTKRLQPVTRITPVWSPVSRDRQLDKDSRSAALDACKRAPLSTLNRVQFAAYQKAKAQRRAYTKWSKDWTSSRAANLRNDFQVYDYAITDPPDGKNYPLWLATSPPKNRRQTSSLSLVTRLPSGDSEALIQR